MLALAPREACQLGLLSTVPQHDVVLEGIHAALWLGSLWFVAPLLTKGDSGANRLRDALILGVAVAFVLAFVGLLWPVAAWLVVTLLLIARLVWRGEPEPPRLKRPFEQRVGVALPILVAAAAAWPATGAMLLIKLGAITLLIFAAFCIVGELGTAEVALIRGALLSQIPGSAEVCLPAFAPAQEQSTNGTGVTAGN